MSPEKLINGVAVGQLAEKAKALGKEPELAKSNFRITNKWINCGHSRTTIKDFHSVGKVHPHKTTFTLDADEPALLLGGDEGANPVEHLLNSLAGCLTGAMVYHAAARGIQIEELESTVEGDIDLRGFMGISDEVRKGYQNIRVTFRVKSDAPEEKLKELCQFSPVFDVVSHGTEVAIDVVKK